jgi:hypothetical protein
MNVKRGFKPTAEKTKNRRKTLKPTTTEHTGGRISRRVETIVFTRMLLIAPPLGRISRRVETTRLNNMAMYVLSINKVESQEGLKHVLRHGVQPGPAPPVESQEGLKLRQLSDDAVGVYYNPGRISRRVETLQPVPEGAQPLEPVESQEGLKPFFWREF